MISFKMAPDFTASVLLGVIFMVCTRIGVLSKKRQSSPLDFDVQHKDGTDSISMMVCKLSK